MLDDYRRKAVAAIGHFDHRGSLPSFSCPSYPITLTKRARRLAFISREGFVTVTGVRLEGA
jgi:hypothetical protein